MNKFTENHPSLESYFRSIILFGKNSASYKFALAKTLLDLSKDETRNTFISFEELSLPFAQHICSHLKISDKQSTSNSSEFLNACRKYNAQEITLDTLIQTTKNLGFTNVLDAFHNINSKRIPSSFFEVIKNGTSKGIVLTDELFKLNQSSQSSSFEYEIESRWRLVESAWSLNLNSQLLNIHYDKDKKLFFINEDHSMRRIDITGTRPALNGYQKGKCFYCFDNISIEKNHENLADVDHFLPHYLKKELNVNLNGVWNLVLACPSCNRGISGKWTSIPKTKYLERLYVRNEFFIDSHHPLRETLINQTGRTGKERVQFLSNSYKRAIGLVGNDQWHAIYEYAEAF